MSKKKFKYRNAKGTKGILLSPFSGGAAIFRIYEKGQQLLASPKTSKQIAITMDDLPGWANKPIHRKDILKKIVEVFKRENVPVTGFVIGHLGSESNENREALRTWASAGLPLANHSWTHTKYSKLSKDGRAALFF